MDEGRALAWLGDSVSRETMGQLRVFVDELQLENQRQNLVAASTTDTIWNRHIVDSAQLARLAPDGGKHWLDIGSGAGLPGIVLAAMTGDPTTLVEPRRLRAEWLGRMIESLELADAQVVAASVANYSAPPADVVTARAFASLDRTLKAVAHLTDEHTTWILPKGRTAVEELASARESWHGDFRMEPSITSPDSVIVVATDVRRRRPR